MEIEIAFLSMLYAIWLIPIHFGATIENRLKANKITVLFIRIYLTVMFMDAVFFSILGDDMAHFQTTSNKWVNTASRRR